MPISSEGFNKIENAPKAKEESKEVAPVNIPVEPQAQEPRKSFMDKKFAQMNKGA